MRVRNLNPVVELASRVVGLSLKACNEALSCCIIFRSLIGGRLLAGRQR